MKNIIKKIYGSIAKKKDKTESCCGTGSACCPGIPDVSENIGYTKEQLDSIPQEADMGLGCGNPTAFASLTEGEVVEDLGSGAGIDVFLASKKVGKTGKVIGIDMTEEMVGRARENAEKGGFNNVEFKLGDIEQIPIDSDTADCIISNCVINLAEDKQKVFNEAFRVLKPGGRFMVSDIVLLKALPEKILASAELYAGCVSGALKKDDYMDKIGKAGFKDVSIIKEDTVNLLEYVGSDKILQDIARDLTQEEIDDVSNAIVSIKITAKK